MKDTGQDALLEQATQGAQVSFGLDAMLQVGQHPVESLISCIANLQHFLIIFSLTVLGTHLLSRGEADAVENASDHLDSR